MNILIKKSIPNSITILNLFLGFVSIVLLAMSLYSNTSLINSACYLILICSVLDSIDGKIARKLNISSDFGKEIDSLADLVSFCMAPSFLLFVYYFNLGTNNSIYAGVITIEWLVILSSLPLIIGAIRLAKFNALKEMRESIKYVGLPTPANAIFICSSILFANRFISEGRFLVGIDVILFKWMYLPLQFVLNNEFIIFGFCIFSSLLLMSKVNYDKFPLISFKINRKNTIDLIKLILFLLLLFLSVLYGYYDIVLLFFMYVYIYGNLMKYLVNKMKN